MIEVNKAEKELANLLFAKEQGFHIPGVLIQNAREKLWAEKGLKQIWRCLNCPDWQLELGVRASYTECQKGHQTVLMWEYSDSPQEVSASPQSISLPESSLPKFHLDL